MSGILGGPTNRGHAVKRPRRYPSRGPAKVLRMPTPLRLRRRRAIRAGMGVLVFSLIGAVVARVYVSITAQRNGDTLAVTSEQEAELLARVNAARARAGVTPLEFSPRLAVAAHQNSYDMAMLHQRPHADAKDVSQAGRSADKEVSGDPVIENTYVEDDRDPKDLADHAVAAWMANPQRRAAMLSPRFTRTGAGIVHLADGMVYVTQDFVR